MKRLPKIATSIAGLAVLLVVGVAIWFFYEHGLSEQTVYRLALDEVQKYALRNNIDLASYSSPRVGDQHGRRLYEFIWEPRNLSGTPLSVVVDPVLVNVKVINAPSMQPNPAIQSGPAQAPAADFRR
jgi:hypothetical protein